MFGGLIAMARRQKMFQPVAEPPFCDWRNRDRRWDEERRVMITTCLQQCDKVGGLSTYNAKATCGSTSDDSAHSEESDTPIRRTPFRSGN
jgi:hypothetical protein